MLTRLATPALVALAALGWECGGTAGSNTGSASSQRPTRADAKPAVAVCSLLTADEIATVTGAKIAEMKDTTYGSTQNCNYSEAANLSPIVSLLLAASGPNVANSAEMAEWQRKQAKNGPMALGDNLKAIIEPIEGLGAPAIRTEIEGMHFVTVQTVVKGRLLEVTTSSFEWSKSLAAKALTRVP